MSTMPVWLTAIFAITVLASLLFIITGAVAAVRTRGKLLRPWLLMAVGLVTLLNVYFLTAPKAVEDAQGPQAEQGAAQ